MCLSSDSLHQEVETATDRAVYHKVTLIRNPEQEDK